tara:strand:- start:677 stop:1282 length:606 start_codon:yes stop_codon:yes gene_type:complete
MADLSKDLTTMLRDIDQNTLERINPERFGIRLTPGTNNNLSAVKLAIERVYLDSLKKNKKEGPYLATCLLAYLDPTGMVPAMGKYCRAADAKPVMRVIAKPHGLFPDLPRPCITDPEVLKSDKGIEARMIYAMYPVFYGDANMQFPKPGDEIEVDFEDQKNMVFGRYLKWLKSSVGTTVSECKPASGFFGDAEHQANPLGQ